MKSLRQPLGLGDVEDREGAQEAYLPSPVAFLVFVGFLSLTRYHHALEEHDAVAFSSLRTNPPSSLVWRKVSQRGKG